MEPFEYDDYSEFDAGELDFDLPSRQDSRRPSRQMSPFEVSIDEDAIEKIRARARRATAEFLDNCDSARLRAKERDEAALKQIDAAIALPPSIPKSQSRLRASTPSSGVCRRRRSLGQPPRNVLEEISALEAFGRDTRPLHEKVQPPPIRPTSRFIRSSSRASSVQPSPRASPFRHNSDSIPPRHPQDGKEKYASRLPVDHFTEPLLVERLSTRRKMRQIEDKLEGILDYEVSAASDFKDMRSALRDINDKMAKHRMLIDRYSGLEMKDEDSSVEDRIFAKVEVLVPRIPSLSVVQKPFGIKNDEIMNSFDPRLVPGYSTGLCVVPNENNKELRGRIRNLLCRTRETSRQDAKNPSLKPYVGSRRREVTVE